MLDLRPVKLLCDVSVQFDYVMSHHGIYVSDYKYNLFAFQYIPNASTVNTDECQTFAGWQYRLDWRFDLALMPQRFITMSVFSEVEWNLAQLGYYAHQVSTISELLSEDLREFFTVIREMRNGVLTGDSQAFDALATRHIHPYSDVTRDLLPNTVEINSPAIFTGDVSNVSLQIAIDHLYSDSHQVRMVCTVVKGVAGKTCSICQSFLKQRCDECSMSPKIRKCSHKDHPPGRCQAAAPRQCAPCPVMVGKCEHMFHGHCIVAWLRKRRTCPLCRSSSSF
jgi:hypothetical protein